MLLKYLNASPHEAAHIPVSRLFYGMNVSYAALLKFQQFSETVKDTFCITVLPCLLHVQAISSSIFDKLPDMIYKFQNVDETMEIKVVSPPFRIGTY